jgi:hypothetical protein
MSHPLIISLESLNSHHSVITTTYYPSTFAISPSKGPQIRALPASYSFTLLSLIMATFPDVSAVDFSIRLKDGHLFQGPVPALDCPFQHTANFDFYRPGNFDFITLKTPTQDYAALRSDLAVCFWETLKMKGRYILAAANNWDGSVATEPLPFTIPSEKLREIGMVHPPFPTLHELTYNTLLLPEELPVLRRRIEHWQQNSKQLSAWIARAKINCARLPNCSWVWPDTPPSCDSTEYDPEEFQDDMDNLSFSSVDNSTFGESPEPSGESLNAHTPTVWDPVFL